MNKNKLIGAALITIGLLILVPSAILAYNSLTVPNTGRINMVGAFWDSTATIEVQEFAWGDIFPNSIQNKTFWLKNFGGSSVNMTLLTSNWTPSNAVNYMQVTWDRQYEIIGSGMTLECTIFLTVFDVTTSEINTTTTFRFNAVFNEAW